MRLVRHGVRRDVCMRSGLVDVCRRGWDGHRASTIVLYRDVLISSTQPEARLYASTYRSHCHVRCAQGERTGLDKMMAGMSSLGRRYLTVSLTGYHSRAIGVRSIAYLLSRVCLALHALPLNKFHPRTAVRPDRGVCAS